MIVEFHVVQNLAPSNINRDDTGTPKNVVFGGARRARVSSQSWKRAIRKSFETEGLFTEDELGMRTKRVVKVVSEELDRLRTGGDRMQHLTVAAEAINSIVGVDDKSMKAITNAKSADDIDTSKIKTKYLVFSGKSGLCHIATLLDQHWNQVSAAKKDERDKAFKDLKGELSKCLDGNRAVDVGLFGRMLANLPDRNVDGATQFAHAISTHTVDIEFDYYTAVDDLKPDDNDGADMIGYVEYVAPTLYRYANVDTAQLLENLGNDEDLTRRTLQAFARSFVESLPGGKRTSMDSSTLPAVTFAVVRKTGRWSLANAFVQPIDQVIKSARRNGDPSAPRPDFVSVSIEEMAKEWEDIKRIYGDEQDLKTSALVRSKYEDPATRLGSRATDIADWLSFIDKTLVFTHENA